MKKLLPIFLWWGVIAVAWGIFRLFAVPEYVSELIAKPILWLGITYIFLQFGTIPKKIIVILQRNYLTIKPIWRIFLIPALFVIFYFFLTNFKSIHFPNWSLSLFLYAVSVNFATGIVEEIVFRGVLYVWLLQQKDEVFSFVLVQILFVAIHIPTLLLHPTSPASLFIHIMFIIIGGMIDTLIFRLNKSLYSSCLSHGLWNTLSFYFLLS